MNISEVRLLNFKKFEQATIDTSAALTLLLGPNSSGKSSILKAILALKQTVAATNESEALATQGEYVDLGTYGDFVYKHELKKRVSLGITLVAGASGSTVSVLNGRIRHEAKQIRFLITFDHNASIEQPQVYSVEIIAKFDGLPEPLSLLIERKKTREGYWLSADAVFSTQPGLELRPHQRKRIRYWTKGIAVSHSSRLVFRKTKVNEVVFHDDLPVTWCQRCLSTLVSILTTQVFYIGPIRSSPSRNYIRTSHLRAVGSRGEYTASVLVNLEKRQRRVTKGSSPLKDQYLFLQTSLEALFPGKTFTPQTIQELVRLEFFDIGVSRTTRSRGESIMDVGFGFSQVFPILVQIAVMPKGALLVVEQPELHLHPLAQTKLASVFERAAQQGKRVLVETHSDHLIRGLQLAVSDSQKRSASLENGNVAAIYVAGDSTTPYRIGFLPNGEFEQAWPEGFLDVGYTTLLNMLKSRS